MPEALTLPKAYDPASVEGRLYQWWMDRGYFSPDSRPDAKPFVIIMPPPNVTGELHLGHALTVTVEDVLVRWHRMLGEAALWLPGTDHAGIATQWVVERALAAEGKTRQQLGREQFEERIWAHVGRYGNRIVEQVKRLGASADWSRQRFTLDPGPAKAVRVTFVNLYRQGLIYRGERAINWCPRCATALSDLEVIHEPTKGKLYFIRYPYADPDAIGAVVVATTRPETMLGDTAVAVHPEDARYANLVGKQVVLPIKNRRIPVVGDPAIDPAFGTGALKVTPAHDATDFEIGQRHNLPSVVAIGLDGKMTEEGAPFTGMDRFEARRAVVARLEQDGLLEKTEDYQHAVGHCQRCNTVVEPVVSRQWFVRIQPLAEPSAAAVRDGRIRIVPERFSRVYLNWMDNIRDWCISRQLWWGHRIPVWYCDDCGAFDAHVEDPATCGQCGSSRIHQDPDVLDTWFSSGLWTHSTLGWPDDTPDVRRFYPTDVMETGYDILFFWVARMIMMGLWNTGKPPFHTVYLHGLVRDAQGVKMSKTKGNVLDPVQLIDRYGTDAMRFALTTGIAPGNDSRVGEAKLEAARNFANKLWNAARYVMSALSSGPSEGTRGWYTLPAVRHVEDRWILSRLNHTAAEMTRYLEEFQIGEAQRVFYDFTWSEFCDWYIEMAKVRLRGGDAAPLPVLAHVLERLLRLAHPFMPFITEELWQHLRRALPAEGDLPESIMIAPYPQADERRYDPAAEADLDLVMRTVRAIRNVRAELRLEPQKTLEAHLDPGARADLMNAESGAIRSLARVDPLHIHADGAALPTLRDSVTQVVGPVAVVLPLAGLVDLAAERQRLGKELEQTRQQVQRVVDLTSKPDFQSNAPDEVKEREEARLAGLRERRERLEEFLARMG